MGFIMRWITDWCLGGFARLFELISDLSTASFDNLIVKSLLSVFQTIGLPLVGLSILVLLLKALLDASDGKEVSFMDIMKRCIGGVIVYTFGIKIMQGFYLVILEVSSKIIHVLIDYNEIDFSLPLLAIDAAGSMITLILLLVMLYNMGKTFFDLIERFWQILVLLCMLYIYLPGYISGNDESIVLWFKQTLGIMLTQIFQVLLVVTGMTIYVSTGPGQNIFLAIGAVIASTKVEQLLDRYGMGAGGKIGALARNGMSVAFYSKSLLRKA